VLLGRIESLRKNVPIAQPDTSALNQMQQHALLALLVITVVLVKHNVHNVQKDKHHIWVITIVWIFQTAKLVYILLLLWERVRNVFLDFIKI